MIKLILASAALLSAMPAAAQPGYDDEWEPRDERVADPAEFDRAARMLDRMVGAIMDLPVGGIAAAVDPLGRGGVRPGDTVRDLARRDDPYAEQRIRASIRGTARGARAMSESLERTLPVLRRSLDEMRRDFEAALAHIDEREPY